MKRFIFSLSTLLLICAGVMLTSCKDKKDESPILTVASADLAQSFSMEGGSRSVAVTANVPFTATVTQTAPNWCVATPGSGTVSITVLANAGASRTAQVTLSADGVPDVVITVTQDENPPYLTVEASLLTQHFGDEGGVEEIAVATNVQFTATVTQADPAWCIAIANSGAGSVEITVTANMGDLRTAEVTLSANGVPDVVITVTQDAKPPFISVDEGAKTQQFGDAGGTKDVVVQTNTTVIVTVKSGDETWCSAVTTTEGITITVLPNDGAERNTTVTLSAADVTETVVITVTQGGVEEITYTHVSTLSFTGVAEAYTLNGSGDWPYNRPYTIACDNNGNLWVSDDGRYLIRTNRQAQTWQAICYAGWGDDQMASPMSGINASLDGSHIYAIQDWWSAYAHWNRLYEFTPNASFREYLTVNTGIPASSADCPHRVSSITTDENGNFWFLDAYARLYKLTAPTRAQPYSGMGEDNLTGFSYELLHDLRIPLQATTGDGIFHVAYSQKHKRLYFSALYMHAIYYYDLESDTWDLFAGSTMGYAEGTGAAARFNNPVQIAVDKNGHVLVGDGHNHCIRRITPDGTTSLIAGTPGTTGTADGTPLSAQFNYTYGVCIDPSDGKTLYVCDFTNQRLRKIVTE